MTTSHPPTGSDDTGQERRVPFGEPEHQPFDLTAVPSSGPRAAALLLHGFMGTPAELRPLGHALAAAGIRAVAPLLPGFGPQVPRLDATRADEWSRAADSAWRTLRDQSDRTVLVGFSFGAALALPLAAATPPDALVLLAPYTRLIDLPSWVIAAGMPVLSRTVKRFSPYAKADFRDAETRRFFDGMDPALDLDDPATRARLRRESSVSLATINQLRIATDRGRKAAPRVRVPALVLQGTRDETSTVERTRALAARLPGPITLREIDADHLIVAPDRPAWPTVRDAVVDFAVHATGDSDTPRV